MNNNIRIFRKRPGEGWQGAEIPNTLEALQKEVGGYIETVTLAKDRKMLTVIICNEDGKLQGLAPNIIIGGELFVGTIIVAGVKGEEFCDVPVSFGTLLQIINYKHEIRRGLWLKN